MYNEYLIEQHRPRCSRDRAFQSFLLAVCRAQRGARRGLPEHMVPSAFIEVPVLPRLPNGKVEVLAKRDAYVFFFFRMSPARWRHPSGCPPAWPPEMRLFVNYDKAGNEKPFESRLTSMHTQGDSEPKTSHEPAPRGLCNSLLNAIFVGLVWSPFA